ncbi:unnamed protein product [Dracunculus medinensis]|uniref:Reverse transcriptase domain-containing protein n=1 Tax=Dracunculus medinensis TaxID=318479 RepID=A0A0N4UF83_DRAME|nr:unnamed protein product [Dracunculus medinensis]
MNTACRHSRGVQINPEHRITDLEYADDVVPFDSYDKMQIMLNNLPTAARIDQFEEMLDFKYLGSTVIPNGQAKDEIVTRITAARILFFRLMKPLWNRREIIKTKIRVHIAAVRSILLYGCETWPVRVEDIKKLLAFDHSCTFYGSAEQINSHIHLRWLGHVLCRLLQELTHTSLLAKLYDGWSQKTWVRKDFGRIWRPVMYGL